MKHWKVQDKSCVQLGQAEETTQRGRRDIGRCGRAVAEEHTTPLEMSRCSLCSPSQTSCSTDFPLTQASSGTLIPHRTFPMLIDTPAPHRPTRLSLHARCLFTRHTPLGTPNPSSPGGSRPVCMPTSVQFLMGARVVFFVPWCVAVGVAIVLFSCSLTLLMRLYAPPPCTPLPRLTYRAHTASAHVGLFAVALCLAAAALPRWMLRMVHLGTVGARAAAAVQGFEAQIEGHGEVEGPGKGWLKDVRCVWSVLCGEEREILRASVRGAVYAFFSIFHLDNA